MQPMSPNEYDLQTIREAMQSVPRCILLRRGGRGWRATNIEGSEDAYQTFHPSPAKALTAFLYRHVDEFGDPWPDEVGNLAFEYWPEAVTKGYSTDPWIRPLPLPSHSTAVG